MTVSNRRVWTRAHGGVAGVGGRTPPLCRSDGQTRSWAAPAFPRRLTRPLQLRLSSPQGGVHGLGNRLKKYFPV